MSNQQTNPLGRLVRQIAGSTADPASSDGLLLRRFLADRDEAAFRTLLRRHGGMVLGVCRGVLRDEHDAEDAFQATFLVLVSKGGSIGKHDALASWLHGVAYRLASRLRLDLACRRVHERRAARAATANSPDEAVWRDLRPVLHEEIERLPDRYRVPFILCCLEGRTSEEAARLLHCPKGTVDSSLSRARARLRGRLTRRGITLTVGALTTLVDVCAAAVPLEHIEKTAQVAFAFAAGEVDGAAGAVSLARNALRATVLFKLKVTAAVLITAMVVTAAGAGLVAQNRPAEEPRPTVANVAPARQAPAKEITVTHDDRQDLTGTWKCSAGATDDKALDDQVRAQLRLILTADKYRTQRGDQVLFEGSYRIDPSVQPKTIDIIADDGAQKGTTAPGIYELDGDTLKLCYGMGAERPTQFHSPKGKGFTMTVWERVK